MRPEPLGQLPELLIAGAAAGGVAAPLLRWRGWRFEWPLLGVPVAVGLWLVDREAAVLVGWACAVALPAGARRHWRELQIGGDVALRARQRIGVPAAALHRLASWTVVRGRALSAGRLLLGLDQCGAVRIPLGGYSGVHTLVVGATGSGKTVTQAWIAAHAIAAGHAAIVIDPKGDNALRQAVKDVLRCHVSWSGFACLDDRKAKRGGCWDDDRQNARNKLLTRQIGLHPEFALDTLGHQCLNTMFMINIHEDEYSAGYVLGVLNSSLLRTYWLDRFYDQRRTFPKIKGTYLKELPIWPRTGVEAGKRDPQDAIAADAVSLVSVSATAPSGDAREAQAHTTKVRQLEARIDAAVLELYEVDGELAAKLA